MNNMYKLFLFVFLLSFMINTCKTDTEQAKDIPKSKEAEKFQPSAFDEGYVKYILMQNKKLKTLSKYRDSKKVIMLKLKNLEEINKSREKEGLSPVYFDVLASRVANMHCIDMIKKNFMGHLSSNGMKPYHRYALAGGTDHIGENVFRISSSSHFNKNEETAEELMLEGHQTFMAEKPPEDGHRRQILKPFHTHVGIAFKMFKGEFRYCQLFVDRYFQLKAKKSRNSMIILGKSIFPDKIGPYMISVYYEKYPKKLRNPKDQPGFYNDYTDTIHKIVPPWNLDYKNGMFKVKIDFPNKKGLYYIIIYAKDNPDEIIYKSKLNELKGNIKLTTSSEGTIPASGIIFKR